MKLLIENRNDVIKDILQTNYFKLLADSCAKYGISSTEISTHRDHSTQTTCPGEEVYSYFKGESIADEVSKVLKAK